jgi:hypothetical protein
VQTSSSTPPSPHPHPPPGGCGIMESEECPPKSHPSPTSGVEGSPRFSRLTTPSCPPASPSWGAGQLSWQAGTQQLFSPRHPSPSRTAPTWAHVARGGIAASFQPVPSTAQQLISPRHPFPSHTAPTWASVARGGAVARIQPASSTTPPSTFTPDDVIAFYRQCVATGLLARLTVRNCAGYEEVNLCCHFPLSPNWNATAPPPRCCRHQWNRHTVAKAATVCTQTQPQEQPEEDD